MKIVRYLMLFFVVLSLSSCGKASTVTCKHNLANGVSRMFSLVEEKDKPEIFSARKHLRTVISKCGIPKNGIEIPMLGDFNKLELLIFSYSNEAFEAELKSKSLSDIKFTGLSTLIHDAAFYGSPKMIRLLIEKGFSVNAKDEFNNTPLMVAVQGLQSDFKNANLLLKHGANINAENEYGISALDWSIINGDVNAVKYLVNKGATIDCMPEIGPSTKSLVEKSKNGAIQGVLSEQLAACEL